MNKKLAGFSSLLVSGFLFSLYGVFSRYISSDFGIFYQSASRYFISIIIFLISILIFRNYKQVKKSDWKFLLLQAFFNFGITIPFYISVINLPLGTALFLFYASSLFSSYIYGATVLKEKLTFPKIISFILAIIGILLIYQDNLRLFNSIYIITAIIGGGFYGLYCSSSKMINQKYSASQINLIEYAIVFLLTIPFVFLRKETVFLDLLSFSWMINFLYALCISATGFLIIYGFKYIEAQTGSLVLLSELVFVIIVGYVFYNEIPSLWVILGGLFILVALALPILRSEKGD